MHTEGEYEAARHPDLIKKLYITDANDNPNKQISDMEDLMAKGCDLIILSAATMSALTPITERAMKEGIPVVLVDRIVATDNYVSYVTAANAVQARIYMQWLLEYLGGEGDIVMLSGIAGAGPAEERLVPVREEVLPNFPKVKVLAHEYTDWSPAKGKQVMAALIQKFGKEIDGVWCDSGLQAAGSVEAFMEAGLKVPPHTGEDHNGFMKLLKKSGAAGCIVAYPVKMGGAAVRVAIQVLQGIPVPKTNEVNRLVTVTPGDETCSVKARTPFDKAVRMDLPDDWQVDNTLPAEYVDQHKK
jgi:ribose transport system substrate-binding protein